MEYRQLGRTPFHVSRIGFGCGPASAYDYGKVDETEWEFTVHAALDSGINFFDVADVYGFGRAEEMLSGALGSRRYDVVVATKCGLVWDRQGRIHRDLSRQSVLRSIDASLQRLRLDVIPLYQIHWPDDATPIEETLEVLAQCQDQGKILHLGVSNFAYDLLRRAYAIRAFDSQQVAFNLFCRDPEREIFPWCSLHSVSVLAHSGLARGLLGGRYAPGDGISMSDTRKDSPYFSEEGRAEKQRLLDAIRSIAAETGRPFPSVAIRWVLDSSHVCSVLIGSKNREQLRENLQAVEWRLDPKIHELLGELSAACPARLAGTPAHGRSAVKTS